MAWSPYSVCILCVHLLHRAGFELSGFGIGELLLCLKSCRQPSIPAVWCESKPITQWTPPIWFPVLFPPCAPLNPYPSVYPKSSYLSQQPRFLFQKILSSKQRHQYSLTGPKSSTYHPCPSPESNFLPSCVCLIPNLFFTPTMRWLFGILHATCSFPAYSTLFTLQCWGKKKLWHVNTFFFPKCTLEGGMKGRQLWPCYFLFVLFWRMQTICVSQKLSCSHHADSDI